MPNGLVEPIYTLESLSPEGEELKDEDLLQKRNGMVVEGPRIVSNPPPRDYSRLEVPYLPIAYRFYRKLKLKHIYKSLTNDIAKHISRPNPAIINKKRQKTNWKHYISSQNLPRRTGYSPMKVHSSTESTESAF